MQGNLASTEYEGLKVLAACINEGSISVTEEPKEAMTEEPTEKIEKGV